jgi:hypothetical protein
MQTGLEEVMKCEKQPEKRKGGRGFSWLSSRN